MRLTTPAADRAAAHRPPGPAHRSTWAAWGWVRRVLAWGVCALAGWAPVAQAQVAPAVAEELMKLSGSWAQLADLGGQVGQGLLAGVRQADKAPSASEMQRLLRAAEAAFAPDTMRAQAHTVVMQQTSPVHLPALLDWYKAPLGQRITALEAASSRASGADGGDQQATLRRAHAAWQAASPMRQALLQRMEVATQAGDAMANVTILSALAIQSGLQAASGQPLPTEGPTLRQLLEAQRADLAASYTRFVPWLLAATYAELNDNELASYLDTLESPAGRHFNGVSIRALTAAMTHAAHLLGQGLATAKDAANA